MITRDSIFIKRNNKNIDLRSLITWNDPQTIRYLAEGKLLTGVFQLHKEQSAKMLKTIFAHLLLEKDIKDITAVDVINRLSDITTLIRPACIDAGADKRYYDRLCGKKVETPVSGSSPFYQIFHDVTNKTQLELLYQEQIMKVLEFIFEISAGNADNYRRAFEKGDKVKLDKYKAEFWDKWNKKLEHLPKKERVYYCAEFWNYLLSVSGYLFNLSHALAYSQQTYITAYIKVTMALMIAITINRHSTDKDKITALLSEAFKAGINIHLPKLGQSYNEATPAFNNGQLDTVYLSSEAIKGIGKAVSNKISSRNNFNSIEDFLKFASKIKLNKAVMGLLVKIGFFSKFEHDKLKVWQAINDYCDITRETREMKLIKKYNRYIYNPKKGETLIKEDIENKIATVEIREKKWDMGEYEQKYQKDFWNEFFLQKELIGFPLVSISSMYSNYEEKSYSKEESFSLFNSKIEVNSKIIIVQNIRFGTTESGFKWSIITDGHENKYFVSGKHAMINENDVLYIIYSENHKGKNIAQYNMIDHIN